jgi:hypothetical protein
MTYRYHYLLILLLALAPLWGCTRFSLSPALPTLLPTEYVPTAIALTANALSPPTATSQPSIQPTKSPRASYTPRITPLTEPSTARSKITSTPRKTKTQESSPTPRKTATQKPSPTLQNTATQEPSPTPTPGTPSPNEIPFAAIQIIKPGPLSKVTSPVELHAFLVPGAGGRMRVEMIGEDGRLLYREIFIFGSDGAQTNLFADMEYEIGGVAETARVQVSVDDRYGRMMSLSSVEVILLAVGSEDLNPTGDYLEKIVIQEPSPKALIQGGKLIVSGLARTATDKPLLIELIDTAGVVVGSRLAGVAPSPEGGHGLFAAEVLYQVSSPTWVRLTVSERGSRIPGTTHLSSIEILISP